MIKSVHLKIRDSGWIEMVWCFINFFILNYFIFYSFMAACFDNLVVEPPQIVQIIFWVIMGIDIIIGYAKYMNVKRKSLVFEVFFSNKKQYQLKNKSSQYVYELKNDQHHFPTELTLNYNQSRKSKVSYWPPFWVYLDILVLILIIIGFTYNQQYPWTIFLPISSLLRIYEIVQFNDIIRVKLQTYYILSRLYIVVKILYTLILMTQIIGCLFYAVDNYLIKVQYFGPLSLNPALYYQGQLLAFTPIYQLAEQSRYIYAMYYASALISTIAYGDIIPKNPIQNFMVIFYLFLATIIVSWVIQQMIVAIRNDRTSYYTLLNKIKHLSVFLKQKHIQTQPKVVNYLIDNFWRKYQTKSLTHRLSKQLLNDVIKYSNLSHLMPDVLFTYAFQTMKEKCYPEGYILLDNNVQQLSQDYILTPNEITVLIDGKCRVGFTQQMFGEMEGTSTIYGFQEFITGTKDINRHWRVQTLCQTNVYCIQQFKVRSYFKGIIENDVRVVMGEDKFQDGMKIKIQFQKLKQQYLFHKKQTYTCSCCHQQGHNVLECPQTHYIITPQQIQHKFAIRQTFKRNNFKCRKIKQQKEEKVIQIDYIKILADFYQQSVDKTVNKYNYDEHSYSRSLDIYLEWQSYGVGFNCLNSYGSQYFHQLRHQEKAIHQMK